MSHNTNKKGHFSRWSETSARWYEEASEYTKYHEELKKHIAPHISNRDTCCELACGTGTLARHLAPLAAHYTANDIDPRSMEFCRQMQNKNPIPNLDFAEGDWHTALSGKTFDIAIFSYFGAIIRDWDTLHKIVEKKIIAVVPRYNALEISEKKKATATRSRFAAAAENPSDTKKKNRRFETMDAVSDFLKEQNVSHEVIPLTLEFGQPCRTLADAEEYVRYYYKFENEDEMKKFIGEKFQPAACGYYFPKKKNIGIVIADLKKTVTI